MCVKLGLTINNYRFTKFVTRDPNKLHNCGLALVRDEEFILPATRVTYRAIHSADSKRLRMRQRYPYFCFCMVVSILEL